MNSEEKAVTVEDLQSTTAKVKAIHKKMVFAAPLTPSERPQLKAVRIGESKVRVLQNRLAAAQEQKDLLPPAFDLRQFERDVSATVSGFELVTALKALIDEVKDTLCVLGHRAVVGGQTVHTHIKAASTSAERLKPLVGKVAVRKGRSSRAAPALSGTTPAPAQPAAPAPSEPLTVPIDPDKKAA